MSNKRKKHQKCTECKKLYALLDLTTIMKKDLVVCVNCLKELAEAGEIAPIDGEAFQYINQLIESARGEESEVESAVPMVVTPKSTQEEGQQEELSLHQYGVDLTALAKAGKLEPVIGREDVIENVILTLSRKTKKNPILIGEPGVGKTANAEGLAIRIASGEVPEGLKGLKVFTLELGSIVAGTKYRGEFEARMKTIIDEAKKHDDIILFIDEFHNLIGAGGADGAIDAAELLKPALSRGEIQVIGATTREEYRKYVEKDAALNRRFNPIDVEEPTKEQAFLIMKGLKGRYEEFHHVNITEEALEASVELSIKYVADKFLPDKAISLLDEACALKKIAHTPHHEDLIKVEEECKEIDREKDRLLFSNQFNEASQMRKRQVDMEKKRNQLRKEHQLAVRQAKTVTREDVASILQKWTGIPVSQLKEEDRTRLKGLGDALKQQVKGQDEAIEVVSKHVRRGQLGLKDPKRPNGVFLFLGPTGVGKTELAKALAKQLYGSEDAMIPLDMSEFMEKHSVSKLIGAPPGYVGYDDEGKLTKGLRRRPYSLVLFDEIEKAHPDVLNIMLQLFEEGRITNSRGQVIDCRHAVFILTSNAGSNVYSTSSSFVGFGVQSESKAQTMLKDKVLQSIKEDKTFRPELLNRLDATLVFNPMTPEIMEEIASKMVDEFTERMKESGYELHFDPSALAYLGRVGYAPEFGARQLRREVEKIGDQIGDYMLENESKRLITVTVNSDVVTIS